MTSPTSSRHLHPQLPPAAHTDAPFSTHKLPAASATLPHMQAPPCTYLSSARCVLDLTGIVQPGSLQGLTCLLLLHCIQPLLVVQLEHLRPAFCICTLLVFANPDIHVSNQLLHVAQQVPLIREAVGRKAAAVLLSRQRSKPYRQQAQLA